MKRRFSRMQRRMLVWLSGGRCSRCGAQLGSGFHADHIMPFSKGGATIVNNGQALCPDCNLRKAN